MTHNSRHNKIRIKKTHMHDHFAPPKFLNHYIGIKGLHHFPSEAKHGSEPFLMKKFLRVFLISNGLVYVPFVNIRDSLISVIAFVFVNFQYFLFWIFNDPFMPFKVPNTGLQMKYFLITSLQILFENSHSKKK